MAPSQSPFTHQLPSFSASALEFAVALVSGKDISHVLVHALPVDSLVRKKGYTDDLRSLAKREWFSTGLIGMFMHLLPTSHDSCVVLPVNYLVGESGSAPASVMFGIGLVHNHSLGRQVFATTQTDGYQCGPIAVRALVHLLFQTDFALGKHALHNVCIWMAACIAEGKLCM